MLIRIIMINYDKQIIVVTGGAGFIGTALVNRLSALQAKEIRVIDCNYYQQENTNYNQNVKIFNLDLAKCSQEQIDQVCVGADIIYHLAAQKHNQNKDDQQYMYSTNVDGTNKLLQSAKKNEIKNFIFASSLYAYGRSTKPALAEDENIIPTTFYGTTKLIGELLCRSCSQEANVKCSVLRLFFVYGPGQLSKIGYESLMVKSLSRLQKKLEPIIYGDGKQVLDYIYIEDVINALLLCQTQSTDFELFNIGSGSPISVLEITNKLLLITKSTAQIKFEPPDLTAGTYRVAKTERALKHLNFIAKTTLDQGLLHTYKAFSA